VKAALAAEIMIIIIMHQSSALYAFVIEYVQQGIVIYIFLPFY